MTEPTLKNAMELLKRHYEMRIFDDPRMANTELGSRTNELLKAYAERKPEVCIECKNAIGHGWCTICDGEQHEAPEAEQVTVWAVADIATGEVQSGEGLYEHGDNLYELVAGMEWREFQLVPLPSERKHEPSTTCNGCDKAFKVCDCNSPELRKLREVSKTLLGHTTQPAPIKDDLGITIHLVKPGTRRVPICDNAGWDLRGFTAYIENSTCRECLRKIENQSDAALDRLHELFPEDTNGQG